MNDERFLWTMSGMLLAALITVFLSAAYVIGDILENVANLEAQVKAMEFRQNVQYDFSRFADERLASLEQRAKLEPIH